MHIQSEQKRTRHKLCFIEYRLKNATVVAFVIITKTKNFVYDNKLKEKPNKIELELLNYVLL